MADPIVTKLIVNGEPHKVTTDPDRSLLEVLREDLRMTGTKYGCGEGACGACAVLVDGKRTFSCSTIVREAAGRQIRTIEGLATGDALHPVQQAFLEEQSFQCGYCTAGMIMGAVALLERNKQPGEEQIRDWMNPHICRCCTYPMIAAAVKRAAEIGGAKA